MRTQSPPRRLEIMRAALRILGADGPGALTHRAVAQEAGVPLAATTYYFDSKEEIIRESLESLVVEEVERLQAARAAIDVATATPREIAHAIAAVLAVQFKESRDALAKFEVYLQGARRTDLREAAAGWVATFTALARDLFEEWGVADAELAAEVLVAGIDGLLLQQLATTGTIDEAALARQIEVLTAALARG